MNIKLYFSDSANSGLELITETTKYATLTKNNHFVIIYTFTEYCFRLHDELNDNPDLFYRQTEYQLYTQAREAAARFVGADPENLVFVQNATTGQICLQITIYFVYLDINCTLWFRLKFLNTSI